jgi:hypothetical protein
VYGCRLHPSSIFLRHLHLVDVGVYIRVQKAFDRTDLRYLKSRSRLLFNSALLLCLIHGSRYCPPRYVVTLSLLLSASFNRAYTSGSTSCCLTNLVTPPLSYSPRAYQVLHSRRSVAFVKNPRCHLLHLSHSSFPLALILSLFTHIFVVVLYIYVTNHSIQASQELSP